MQPDALLETFTDEGAAVPESVTCRFHRGGRSACHANAVALWRSGKALAIGTGYALSDDGLWREHSWAWDGDGVLLETTESRTRYFGIRMEGTRAEAFASWIAPVVAPRPRQKRPAPPPREGAEPNELLDLLRSSSSAARRKAAKRLRKAGDRGAGPELFDALSAEVLDPRTWETQYHMIMAIGSCGYVAAAPLLEQLAWEEAEDTMVGTALGDTLVVLETHGSDSLTVFDRLFDAVAPGVQDGMVRALARLRAVPEEDLVDRLVTFGLALTLNDPRRYWLAVAAAGWEHPKRERFLHECTESEVDGLPAAAQSSLRGRYVRMSHV